MWTVNSLLLHNWEASFFHAIKACANINTESNAKPTKSIGVDSLVPTHSPFPNDLYICRDFPNNLPYLTLQDNCNVHFINLISNVVRLLTLSQFIHPSINFWLLISGQVHVAAG